MVESIAHPPEWCGNWHLLEEGSFRMRPSARVSSAVIPMTTEGRRSVEPMAAGDGAGTGFDAASEAFAPCRHATWSDEQMLTKVRVLVVPSMTQRSPIEAWIIDDTSFPKKGRHSVGVHHQYCGQLGKQANCQVAVTLSIANHHASLPIAYRLYLPRDWINDRLRRAKAHVPRDQIQDQATDCAGADPGVRC